MSSTNIGVSRTPSDGARWPVIASLVQLDHLDRKARSFICIIQQVLLFFVGLCSWPSCGLRAQASHLAMCAAFWLLAYKEVKPSHALLLQAAETAIAIAFRLSQVLPGQATFGEVACIAACYLAIGLLTPAAVYYGSSSREEPLGQAAREASCSSTRSSNGRAATAVVHDHQPGAQKHDSAGVAPSNVLGEDLLLRVCELKATGVLSPCLVQQQLEAAAKRAQDISQSLPSNSNSAPRSSMSSSRCPSTRPSTSFSSTSLGFDSSAAFLIHSGGTHLAAAMHGSSDTSLHHSSSEQANHTFPKVPAPSGALSLAHHQRPWSLHSETCYARNAATQTGPDLHVQLLGRHRPGRSRTALNLLGPAEREELPPIVEAAHEGTQQQQQQLNSPTQKDQGRRPSQHFEHKTWPPASQPYKQQQQGIGTPRTAAASHAYSGAAGRVSVEGGIGVKEKQEHVCHVPVEQASSTARGSGSGSSCSSKVAASVTCRQGELTDSRGGSCSMATEASLQELVQASGGKRRQGEPTDSRGGSGSMATESSMQELVQARGGRRSGPGGGTGSQAQGRLPGQVTEAEASARDGSRPSTATVPACLEPAKNVLARKLPASLGAKQQQQQQQQRSSASGGEAHATDTASVREEVVEGGTVDSKQACNEVGTGTCLTPLDPAGSTNPAAPQQHRRSSAQGSSAANTLIHTNSKHEKEGCDPAGGTRGALTRSSTGSTSSGQAAAAAAAAVAAALGASGEQKGPPALNGSHRTGSNKRSSSPLRVNSLKHGSPAPSEPGQQQEAAGEAHSGAPAREDFMGAWLDQQILLSNKAQNGESKVEANGRQAASNEQAAPPPRELGGLQQGAQGSVPSKHGEASSPFQASPGPTAANPLRNNQPTEQTVHETGNTHGVSTSLGSLSKPAHSPPTHQLASEPPFQVATSGASKPPDPAGSRPQAAAPQARTNPPLWVGSSKSADKGEGKQQQHAASNTASREGKQPRAVDSDSMLAGAAQPSSEPVQSLAGPRGAGDSAYSGNAAVAGHNAHAGNTAVTGHKASQATAKVAGTHRNNSFRFDHPRPATAPTSSPPLPPVSTQQQGSAQAPSASAHSAARALLGNSPHLKSPDRGTRSAQTSPRSSVEQPWPIIKSSLDQARGRDRGGDSPQSQGSSTLSRRVSFHLPAEHSLSQRAPSVPPDNADPPGKETSTTQAPQPPSLHQQQQHKHQASIRPPSLPTLDEQQQLPPGQASSLPPQGSSPAQHPTGAASRSTPHAASTQPPASPLQSQPKAQPTAATPVSPPRTSGGISGAGPGQQELQHITDRTEGAHPGASQPSIIPGEHGRDAHQGPAITESPPNEPYKAPFSTRDHGRDANFSNTPFSPPMSPPQEEQDGSLARRFPPQRERSSLLKNVLPDSVRANLQSIPSKATDQQQPTSYAGSAQLRSNKIRPTGESTEVDVENTIIANRRYLDASKVLLDEVQVNKVLGFGSMGMVYFGVLWDTKVVVKMIEHGAGLLGKEQNRGKLARTEAVLSRMLLHPNMVITYDCCTGMMDATRLQVSGTPSRALRGKAGRQRQMTVMVQEFCDAGALSDALEKRRHGLDMTNPGYVELVMQLTLDIANGIKYMHSLRVLHVDLKAENILLTHSNTGTAPAHNRPGHLTAKVADLGLALVLSMDSDEVQSGIHGTVSHMPPEAMRGTTFSMATDVYSFGVVIWELVTQGKPFAGLKAHQVVEAVCDFDERPPWPETLHPKFAGLRDLASRCWDASPCNRPSIFEVVDHLHEVIDPSLAVKSSDGAGSMVTDESDELELALKSQAKAPAPTSQQLAHPHASEQAEPLRANKDAAAEAAAHAQRPCAPKSSSSGRRRSSFGSKRASSSSGVGHLLGMESQKRVTGLQAIMAAGPPRDMLSRMLYYLAQVPPQREQLQQVEVGGGIVRLAAAVDMSGLRAR